MTTSALLRRLIELKAERMHALEHGLGVVAAYMFDLGHEIAVCRHVYPGAAGVERATLRVQLSGPHVG